MAKYEPIKKIESPFPVKPREPNYFPLDEPGEWFSYTDTNVYPKEEEDNEI